MRKVDIVVVFISLSDRQKINFDVGVASVCIPTKRNVYGTPNRFPGGNRLFSYVTLNKTGYERLEYDTGIVRSVSCLITDISDQSAYVCDDLNRRTIKSNLSLEGSCKVEGPASSAD